MLPSHLFSAFLVMRPILPTIVRIGTPAFRRKVVEWLPLKIVQEAIEVIDIMHEESISIYNSKKTALAEEEEAVVQQSGKGKDILSILR